VRIGFVGGAAFKGRFNESFRISFLFMVGLQLAMYSTTEANGLC
jgi:hypothetical protein